ncbi:integrator complex subunit 14 [Ctenocephalides felis]|uniref:integrator complex subunit 14 n=1 Tax=Ctenocephalides felis TaxID=7515 RepID=UPI000E6E226C|nr:integrator complex subunit 14 [Ctenocephalides felis]
MPTVLMLDASYSMSRCNGSDKNTILQLAIQAVHSFLDYLAIHCKLEFVALTVFSSTFKCICNFTRDYASIKEKLNAVEELDKTNIETAFKEVNNLVINEWGINTPCHVVLITDGCAPLYRVGITQFSFPAKLHIICMCRSDDKTFMHSKSIYEELLTRFGSSPTNDLHTMQPDTNASKVNAAFAPIDAHTISEAILHFSEQNYHEHRASLKCGGLSCDVFLFPPPEPYLEVTEYSVKKHYVSRHLEVCGFLSIADVGSPMAISRHLLLPAPVLNMNGNEDGVTERKNDSSNAIEMMQTDDDSSDEGRQPSFCVLLHGALRKESMVALISIADEWFALAYSRADGRKKSGLMLATLKPGTKPLPGLGDLRLLGLEEQAPGMAIRPMEKRSYSQSTVTWIKHSGLQSDIQKLLRHARKLPEKTSHFYKELNRVRRAATSLGFIELLEAMALIFERECASLPDNASPDCALQLTHAAQQLRDPRSRDPSTSIMPVSTKYNLNAKVSC